MFALITEEMKADAVAALEASIAAGLDKQASISAILDAVKDRLAKNARFDVYRICKSCPTCGGLTKAPGIVRDYFTCFSEWHEVKGVIETMMTPIAV